MDSKIHMKIKGPKVAKTLKKKTYLRGPIDTMTFYNVAVFSTVCFRLGGRWADQWCRIENPAIDPGQMEPWYITGNNCHSMEKGGPFRKPCCYSTDIHIREKNEFLICTIQDVILLFPWKP